MLSEFEIIDAIVAGLGDRAAGEWITLGPGDDAAVIAASPGLSQVASIDTLLPDVHFPIAAPAQLIGYRSLMVSFSDLAAMGAIPRYCLVSLSMDKSQAARDSVWPKLWRKAWRQRQKNSVSIVWEICRAVR